MVVAAFQDSLVGLYLLLTFQASSLFGRIRQTVACQAAPATLKSAFLEPLDSQLAAELSVEMFGRKDEDFMGLFTGGWHGRCSSVDGWFGLPPDGRHEEWLAQEPSPWCLLEAPSV